MSQTKLISEELTSLIENNDKDGKLVAELNELKRALAIVKILRNHDCDELIRIAADGSAYLVKSNTFDQVVHDLLQRYPAV